MRRIAVCGLALSDPGSGLGRMTRQALRSLLDIDRDNEYLLLLPADLESNGDFEAPNLEPVRLEVGLARSPQELARQRLSLPARLRGARIDVSWTPSYLLPPLEEASREIVGVHDVAWDAQPGARKTGVASWLAGRLPDVVRRADRVACASEATRRVRFRRGSWVREERLCVVHPGVDHQSFHPTSESHEPEEEAPYIAVVGSQEPQGRVESMLDALPRLRVRMRPCRLVMVGEPRPPARRRPPVDFLGQLDDRELASLYRNARIVVQPTLYEGCGLPLLEAMACGTPVACADAPLFRELAGEAAVYFDARDAVSIARTMEALALHDDRRDEYARRGLERAARFRWEESGRKLLDAILEAAS